MIYTYHSSTVIMSHYQQQYIFIDRYIRVCVYHHQYDEQFMYINCFVHDRYTADAKPNGNFCLINKISRPFLYSQLILKLQSCALLKKLFNAYLSTSEGKVLKVCLTAKLSNYMMAA